MIADNCFRHLVLDFVDSINYSERQRSNTGLYTGFRTLDKYTGGIRPGSLGVIASRPGDGRTAFAISIAMNMAFGPDSVTVGFFSYEISNKSIVERMISNRAQIDMFTLHDGNPDSEIKTRIMETADYLYSCSNNFIIQDSPGLTLDKLSSQIRDMAYKNSVKVVFIEGYGLVGQENFNLQKIDRNTVVCRALSLLAKELDVAIICVCPLHTGGRRRPPLMEDLREFGLIDRFSDYILFIDDSSRYIPLNSFMIKDNNEDGPPYNFRRRKVIVAKNKYGYTGVFNMDYNEKHSLFRDIETHL